MWAQPMFCHFSSIIWNTQFYLPAYLLEFSGVHVQLTALSIEARERQPERPRSQSAEPVRQHSGYYGAITGQFLSRVTFLSFKRWPTCGTTTVIWLIWVNVTKQAWIWATLHGRTAVKFAHFRALWSSSICRRMVQRIFEGLYLSQKRFGNYF